MDSSNLNEENSYRDKISTVDADGKRIWIYPKKPKGKFYNYRKVVSYILVIVLIGTPYLKWNGESLFMFNVFERKFNIFGQAFITQDFFIFVLATITLLIVLVVFTVIFGRVFCGWVCPQTIFMEMVFRRIEYAIEGDYTAQKKLNKAPWNTEKIWKKGLKHFLFVFIAFVIMHTFVAYIIGIDETLQMIGSNPADNPAGFISITVLTGLFYGVFAHFREQVCTSVCPYGRLQGVLLDKQSIVVAYDHKRGEERGKKRKGEDRTAVGKGDCIDCNQCVIVCPTGIDIRNGTQLECINCTACMDACDEIMEKVDLPKGLIRYASEESIEQRTPFRFTTRMAAYSAVMVIMLSALTGFIVLRSDTDVSITRAQGQTYTVLPDTRIANLYRLRVVSKSGKEVSFKVTTDLKDAEVEMLAGEAKTNNKGEYMGMVMIKRPANSIKSTRGKINIIVTKADGKKIDDEELTFLAPLP